MPRTVSYPITFEGSREQADLNYNSHDWSVVDEEGLECSKCASRSYHAAALYACGTEVPRKETQAPDQHPREMR
jgi:hypothetical protein